MTAVPGVDWQVATATGRLLVPPGVDVNPATAAAVVANLRACAERAVDAVAEAAQLPDSAGAEILVVGRRDWLTAVTAMASTMLAAAGQRPPETLGAKVAARAAGAQLGAAFAFVATRILGQFDPYSPVRRLLLVAPNIVAAERAMGLEPHAFRQWVCLHEQTHRAQFGAAPWLPAHLLELMRRLFADEDGPAMADGRRTGLARLLTPGQADTFDQVTAVMSLLEGHADVMMDAAAIGLVPNVARYRAAIEARRDAPGLVQVISRLLGLRAKREQYLHGAEFCRAVIERAGVGTLNRCFGGAAALPSLTELHEPDAWLRRVDRAPAAAR